MDIDLPEVVAQVRAAFDRYEAALVTNDVGALDAMFWEDERTVRFGIDECHYGFADISAYRRAQPFQTWPRTLRNTTVTTFGGDVAVVTTLFVPDGASALGRQSQTWVRLGDGWRVVSAHVSWLSGRGPHWPSDATDSVKEGNPSRSQFGPSEETSIS